MDLIYIINPGNFICFLVKYRTSRIILFDKNDFFYKDDLLDLM